MSPKCSVVHYNNEGENNMSTNLSNNQMLLKTCIQQEFLDSAAYNTENDYFEFFSAVQVLKNYNLSDNEIENGIVGNGNDGGCDSIYVFLNGELLSIDQIENLSAAKGSILKLIIIQSKKTSSFNEDAIMKWKTVSENLLNISNNIDSFAKRYNEGVREGFRLFRDALTKLIRLQVKIQIQYYYVTLATELHLNVKQQAVELKDLILQMYPSAQADICFVGADDLMKLYYTDSDVNINLLLSDNPITLGSKVEYVALVNLSTYYKFITDETGALRRSFFEANVRDYQGKNTVNNCIAETLSNNDGLEDFWWLNNGITILADNITQITTKELSLLNPEIVNGLQTSTEIYNYFSNNPLQLEKEARNVLVRVIVPESEEIRDNIIFATNNQTNIPKSSLRVTDTIHLQIEMYFKSRGLYYDRRKNYYKNQKKRSTEIVGVSFLAQCLISIILRKPDFARARPSTLLTDDNTYSFLYEENQNLEAYYKAALLGKKVHKNLSLTQEMTPAERSDVLFYLLYAVAAKVLNKKEIDFTDLENLDCTQVADTTINTIKEQVYTKYKELGGNGRVAKSSSFIDEIYSLLGF